MALLDTLKTIIEDANQAAQKIDNTVPTYKVEYEETNMMNIKVDEFNQADSFIYIEEFIQGKYQKEKYFHSKSMKMQIYCCKFTGLQSDAVTREHLREAIEREIVLPFMDTYKTSGLFDEVTDWNIYYPFPRFDANEVSIMLEFDCKIKKC